MKKKILFVAYAIYGGGSENRLMTILRGLDRAKIEPHLCVLNTTGREAEVVPKDIPVYPLRTALRPASLFLVWKLFWLLRELKPDKVFSVLWSVNIISALAARAAGIPVILNEATTASESIKRYSFPALRKRLISALYKGAETVVAVSDFTKADLTANFGIPAEKIVTVRSAVPAGRIAQQAAAYKPGQEGYVLGCGGLNWWKNYSLLIKGMRGQPDTRLIILGKGPMKDRLLEEAGEAGVSLDLPGHIDNPYPYFKQASVFVLTSFYEGFPNVILEAMACGTPVIAVDCPGGIREVITHGETGLIVPVDSPEALGAAIKKILGDRALAGKLSSSAAANINKNFSLEAMVLGYEKVLAG